MTDLSSIFAQGLRKPTMAELLMKQSISTAPAQGGWGEGLARALMGGMAGYFEKQDQDAEGGKFDQMFGLKAGAPQPVPTASAAPYDAKTMGAALTGDRGASRIYSQDERNPLDLPAGQDRDMLIRAIHAEAGNQGPEGMRAVASVVRNRAADGGFGGDTVPGVLKAPNQFEPMNTAQGQQRMAALPAGGSQYNTIGKAVDGAYAGNDPTNGATNFFAPKAQAALGRPVPAWAQGPGQDIGDHRFYGSPQMAQNDPAALPPNATPTQGTAPPMGQPAQGPQQRQAPQVPPDVLTRARSMWTSGDPTQKAAAMALMQPYLAPKDQTRPMTAEERTQWRVPEGMSAGINAADGKPVFSPAQTNVSVNSVADPIREGVGKTFNENRTHALTASREIIPQLHDARSALDQGALTGQFADFKLMMHKVGTAVFGMTDDQASNTETFRATIGRQVLGMAKSLGANPSNADRDYIEKVQGGQIKLEEGSLRRLMDITEKYARQSIVNHNADAEKIISVQPDAYKGVAPIMSVTMPPEYQKPTKATAPAPQSDPQEGQTATNPQTGQKIMRKGGQWVPVQ